LTSVVKCVYTLFLHRLSPTAAATFVAIQGGPQATTKLSKNRMKIALKPANEI